jgi:tripartite-type tricarboxylate transporter receptor subunit TctC
MSLSKCLPARAQAFIIAMMAGLIAAGGFASAQDYPTRPVRVILASSAGGTSDVFMRAVAEQFQQRTGQPLVIENRPGGAFNIAARACTEAVPDGYTLCVMPNEPVTYNLFLFKNIDFDPDKGLAPITNLLFMTQTLAVSQSLNVKNLADLAALSKSKPRTLSYSSPAHAQALFVERFKGETGADLVRVPFRGGGDAVTGLISGTTPVVFIALGNLISHVRAGTVQPLLVDSEKRSTLIPDTPTLLESGYRGDMTRSYFGLFAPGGTSQAHIARIHSLVAEIAADPSFADRHLIQRGLEPAITKPEQFAAFIKQDRAASERIVKASGLEPQ